MRCHPYLYYFIAAVILISGLGILSFINTLHGEFIWDDDVLIKNNEYIRNWQNLPDIFKRKMGNLQHTYPFYRPLQMFSFMAEYSLWGLDVRGYHAVNITGHVLVSLCVFWLVFLISDNWIIALFTGMLFVVHPVHTDVVSHITGRCDIFSALFAMLCYIFYIKLQRLSKNLYGVISVICFALAIFSKESVIIIPILLLFYDYAFNSRTNKVCFAAILFIEFLYFSVRFFFLETTRDNFSWIYTVMERIPGFFAAIRNYIGLLLFPVPLQIVYPYRLFKLTEPKVIQGIIIVLFILALAIKCREKNKQVFFAIGWFFVLLLPSSNLYPLVCFYMAERYMYLPSIGFFIILAQLLYKLFLKGKGKFFAIIILLIFITFYSIVTIRQNNILSKTESSYKTALKYYPEDRFNFNNLGNYYAQAGKIQKAKQCFKKSVKIEPNVFAYGCLAELYIKEKNYRVALKIYNKILKFKPLSDSVYSSTCVCLGRLYNIIEDKDKAVEFFIEAIRVEPQQFAAYDALGILFAEKGMYKEAIDCFKQAIGIQKRYLNAYYHMGMVYLLSNDIENAKKSLEFALQLDSRFKPARDKLNELNK